MYFTPTPRPLSIGATPDSEAACHSVAAPPSPNGRTAAWWSTAVGQTRPGPSFEAAYPYASRETPFHGDSDNDRDDDGMYRNAPATASVPAPIAPAPIAPPIPVRVRYRRSEGMAGRSRTMCWTATCVIDDGTPTGIGMAAPGCCIPTALRALRTEALSLHPLDATPAQREAAVAEISRVLDCYFDPEYPDADPLADLPAAWAPVQAAKSGVIA